jgi:hypothetical protein
VAFEPRADHRPVARNEVGPWDRRWRRDGCCRLRHRILSAGDAGGAHLSEFGRYRGRLRDRGSRPLSPMNEMFRRLANRGFVGRQRYLGPRMHRRGRGRFDSFDPTLRLRQQPRHTLRSRLGGVVSAVRTARAGCRAWLSTTSMPPGIAVFGDGVISAANRTSSARTITGPATDRRKGSLIRSTAERALSRRKPHLKIS